MYGSMVTAGPGGVETHGWSLLSTVMTEVLSKAEWLKLWDHVLSNSPPFLMFLLLSYLVYFRAQIMSAQTMQQMDSITRRCNPLDLNKVACSTPACTCCFYKSQQYRFVKPVLPACLCRICKSQRGRWFKSELPACPWCICKPQ